jgi:Protein of unknown function (DUF3011)
MDGSPSSHGVLRVVVGAAGLGRRAVRATLATLLAAAVLGGCLLVDGRRSHGPYEQPGYAGGPERSRGDVQEITCESKHGRRRRCPADGIIRGVELARVLSNTRCIYRENWGWDERDVWVDGGCRARFRVALSARGGRSRGGYDDDLRRERVLDCESGDGRYVTCPVGFPISEARIVTRHSRAECRHGASWGWRGAAIWVDRGCRARFRVYAR